MCHYLFQLTNFFLICFHHFYSKINFSFLIYHFAFSLQNSQCKNHSLHISFYSKFSINSSSLFIFMEILVVTEYFIHLPFSILHLTFCVFYISQSYILLASYCECCSSFFQKIQVFCFLFVRCYHLTKLIC